MEIKAFHEIGCRKCGNSGWRIFTDGKGNFKAKCSCGHISDFKIVNEPDIKSIDARFFS